MRSASAASPPRIVSDHNLLAERFPHIAAIHVAPPFVIDAAVAERLRGLSGRLKLLPPDALGGVVTVRSPVASRVDQEAGQSYNTVGE